MTLPTILRSQMLLAALIVVMAAGAAGAATIRVGVDGGASVDPELVDPCMPSCSVEIYLDLEAGEVASVFEADFDILMTGSWTVTLDLSEVNPGVIPFGVGTWPNAVGNDTSTRISVSLTSENEGGERLVAQLDLVRDVPASPAVFELFLGSDSDEIIVAMDVTGGTQDVPLTSPNLGARLFVTPEPSTSFLLLAGLMGLTVVGRQPRA